MISPSSLGSVPTAVLEHEETPIRSHLLQTMVSAALMVSLWGLLLGWQAKAHSKAT